MKRNACSASHGIQIPQEESTVAKKKGKKKDEKKGKKKDKK
jgi:hypothetical protein